MFFQKKTDYAVRALLYLTRFPDQFCSSRDIAQSQKIPLAYMRALLQRLVKAGYVESKEGVAGGSRLLQDPEIIRVSDLVRLFQGTIELSSCLFRKKICIHRSTCVLRQRMKGIEQRVIAEFDALTIGLLARDLEK